MKRKVTAIILALVMMVTLMPAIPAYADEIVLTVGTGGDHPTLAAALAVAQDGDTITLLNNINESVSYTVQIDKTITIDGGNGQYMITADDGVSASSALSLSGAGTIILKNLSLQGGTVTASGAESTGLKVSGSVNVQSIGTVNSSGGNSSGYGRSCGVKFDGTGTVNVTNATGGTSGNSSMGVYLAGAGTVNLVNATGGTATNLSAGTFNNTGIAGTINVTNATGGDGAKYSHGLMCYAGTVNVTNAIGANANITSNGVSNYGGHVNVLNAAAGTSTTSTGVFCANPGALTNVATATGSTVALRADYGGVINTGAATTSLTLNKREDEYCVLDSITIASSGATQVGVLPQVTKNGVIGNWYTDNAKTTTFSGTTVNGITNLCSTFYDPYIIYTIANQTMTPLTSGYVAGTQETKALTIARKGTGDIESLATELSGANAASFAITQPDITTLNSGTPSTTFTVKAKDGLAAGTYTATITITATSMSSVNFTVTQVVNAASSGSGSDSGSGSGSGGGNSTPATPVINTNTGSVTGNQLKNAADAAKDGGTVTIKSNETSEVTMPNSGLDSLAGKNNSLKVVTENGTLTFDSKAVGAIGTQATATDIKVIVDDVVKTTLTEEQQAKVGDKTVYDLTVMSGGKRISNFNGGKVTVSIPYDLKTGETAANLTVWYMADNGSLTEINCTYDAKAKAVTFVVEHFSTYIIGYDGLADWANPFTDVMSSAWYYDAVAFVNKNGLMKGRTDTAFGPQTEMTRGMFVTILGRMEGVDTTLYASKNTFSDVNNTQYYAPYIAWATDKSIVSGMGGEKFAPSASVTREQMAVMMMNYMKFKGQGPKGEWAIQLTYGDLDNVSSWADEAVMFMTMKDLMNGMGNDAKGNPLFSPKSTSTRAQTAQVMMSLGELVK